MVALGSLAASALFSLGDAWEKPGISHFDLVSLTVVGAGVSQAPLCSWGLLCLGGRLSSVLLSLRTGRDEGCIDHIGDTDTGP